jgi:hypothetical protein
MEGILTQGRVDAQPYNWPHDASLDSKTTALVIIDMQKDCKYTTLSNVAWFSTYVCVEQCFIFLYEMPFLGKHLRPED